jgi:hypothetical protein
VFFLRRIAFESLLALIVLASAAGCGRRSETNSPADLPFAYVQRDCGPADGEALTFYFTQKQSQSGEYEEPFVEISINENLPRSAPLDYSVESGKYAILASRCRIPGRCDTATSGTLHLDTFRPGKGATGVYELHFGEASKRAPLMLLGPSRNNLSSAGKIGPSLPYGSSSGRVSCGSGNKSKREFRRECLPARLFHPGIVAVDRVLG